MRTFTVGLSTTVGVGAWAKPDEAPVKKHAIARNCARLRMPHYKGGLKAGGALAKKAEPWPRKHAGKVSMLACF